MSKAAKTLSAIVLIWTSYIIGKLFTKEKILEVTVTDKNVFDDEEEGF